MTLSNFMTFEAVTTDAGEDTEKREPSYTPLVGTQAGTANGATLQLSIYPKDTKIQIQRGTCIQTFIAAMSTVANLRKEPGCPRTGEWIKTWSTHIRISTMGFYSATKKNEILPSARPCIELEGGTWSASSQRGK